MRRTYIVGGAIAVAFAGNALAVDGNSTTWEGQYNCDYTPDIESEFVNWGAAAFTSVVGDGTVRLNNHSQNQAAKYGLWGREDVPFSFTTGASLEARVKVNDPGVDANGQWIVLQDASTTVAMRFFSNQFQIDINGNFGFQTVAVDPKQWHTYRVAAATGAGNARLYIDDVLVALEDTTLGTGVYGAAPLYFGDITESDGQTCDWSFDYLRWTTSGAYAPVTNPGSTWQLDGNGDWGASANWLGGVPNDVDKAALFGSAITADRTVQLPQERAVGKITFDNAHRYTIAGAGTLILGVSTGSAEMNVLSGSHTVNAPLLLTASTNINVAAGTSEFTLGGDMACVAGVVVSKTGAGTVAAKNVRSDGLSISGGTVRISASATPNGAQGLSYVGSLSIAGGPSAPTATLDLKNNAMGIGGGLAPADTRQLLAAGSSGNGIVSDTSDASKRHGYSTAGELGITVFNGINIPPDTMILLYTYSGDANIDGKVNTLDFNSLAGSFGGSSKVWTEGDFDYNGNVDSLDFNALVGNYGKATSLSAPSLGSVVPEPSAALALFVAMPLLKRRRA
jgi:hypothetical protein